MESEPRVAYSPSRDLIGRGDGDDGGFTLLPARSFCT